MCTFEWTLQSTPTTTTVHYYVGYESGFKFHKGQLERKQGTVFEAVDLKTSNADSFEYSFQSILYDEFEYSLYDKKLRQIYFLL